MTAAAAKGHTSKHTGTRKHRATSKHHATHQKKAAAGHTGHHVTTKATHAHHAKARGFALASDLLPVCSLEAVAQSLRLLGQPVADDEVAWLWELAGSRVLSIPEALAAAARHGLNGCRPVFAVHPLDDLTLPFGQRSHVENVDLGEVDHGFSQRWLRDFLFQPVHEAGDGVIGRDLVIDVEAASAGALHALILGVDHPGPHAVLATPAGWWSWGQLYDPWPCAIEEAWAVSWS